MVLRMRESLKYLPAWLIVASAFKRLVSFAIAVSDVLLSRLFISTWGFVVFCYSKLLGISLLFNGDPSSFPPGVIKISATKQLLALLGYSHKVIW